MSFDFDTPVSRIGTDSQKWQKYAGREVLPMWVADMDFKSSPAIVEALHRRVDHGVFGYARPTASTTEAIVSAMAGRYSWKIDPEWLVWLPGLVCGLNVLARGLAEPNDEILSFSPVYPPFTLGPKFQQRSARPVPLLPPSASHPHWTMDWAALEAAVTPRTRMVYFCQPHNPLARVWRRVEIRQLADFCARHDLILCSDEIHCDLILEPSLLPHVPTVAAAPEHAARIVTLMAPSKAYNLPGLGTSFAIISDPELRTKFLRATRGIVAEVTSLGFAACEAAYRDGEPWRDALVTYLRGNRDHLMQTLKRDFPKIRLEAPVEATYLAWLNVHELGLEHPQAHFEALGVGLSDGAPFGAQPGHYLRINFGCPRSVLQEAFRRLAPLKI
ncbi:MAG TPA: PatB family C-S lyase [Opitutaceae bacterium]|jgi:cystathionine beta-lyase